MNHSFNTELASEIGLSPAVILENIAYWVNKNKANGTNLREGRYWTFSTMEGFRRYFPYLTFKQIRYALDKLEQEGYLIVGCFNEKPFDRTKWYTLGEKAEKFYLLKDETPAEENPSVDLPKMANGIAKNGKSDLPKMANGIAKNGKPIPYINTYINKDIDIPPLTPQGEIPIEKPKAKKFDVLAYILSRGVGRQVAEDFLAHRKQLKASVTKTAVDRMERKAITNGYTLEEAMAETCAQGWRGFYPSKDRQQEPARKKTLEEVIAERHRSQTVIDVNAKEVAYDLIG